MGYLFISCVEDDRTDIYGYDDCPICNGKGYCKKTEFLGLSTSYWDCFMCKRRAAGEGYYEDNNYEENDDYSDEISFRGRQVIYEDYGSCNRGCGCTQYAHYPGQTKCVNCAENGCSSNKFGHRKAEPL